MKWASVITALLLVCAIAAAHDSPEHVVEALTKRMEQEGRTPSLLVRRAYEHQSLGHYAEAEADLNEAIQLDAQFAEAYARLAHVFNAQDKYDEAAAALASGLEHARSDLDTVELLAIRAELHESNGAYAKALADCEAVLKHRPEELDPLLLKSRLLAQMDNPEARVDWLRAAGNVNPSIVLDIELTDALIDAGNYDEALARVIEAANGRRWLSAWRIRRARIHLGENETAEAHNELRLALKEIDTRMSADWVDPILLLQRATAQALLGETDAARNTLQAAKQSGAAPWELKQVETLIGD